MQEFGRPPTTAVVAASEGQAQTQAAERSRRRLEPCHFSQCSLSALAVLLEFILSGAKL